MQVQLVDEANFDRLADDVSTAHDDDMARCRDGTSLRDRVGQIGHEGESHPELLFEPDLARRRVGNDAVADKTTDGNLGLESSAGAQRPAWNFVVSDNTTGN